MFLVYTLFSFVAVLLTVGIALVFGTPWWIGIPLGIVLYLAALAIAAYFVVRYNERNE